MSQRPTFLTADWIDLAVVSYFVDPLALHSFIPNGVQCDLFNGRAVISIVGFYFDRAVVKGLALPFHRQFPEINVRFYAKPNYNPDDKKGVFFIKEIAPRHLVAIVAWLCFNENFSVRKISYGSECSDDTKQVRYQWKNRDSIQQLCMKRTSEYYLPSPGTLEYFLSDRYFGYGELRDKSTIEFQVDHPPWQIAQASPIALPNKWESLLPSSLATLLENSPPDHCMIMQGSHVQLSEPSRLQNSSSI